MELEKIINTIKYMTPRQWKYRLYYTFRNKLLTRTPVKKKCSYDVLYLPLNYMEDIACKDTRVADDILDNHIPIFTNKSIHIEKDFDWDLKNEKYRLVCFRLNSFKYLLNLSDAYKSKGDSKYIDKGFALIENWIEKNQERIAGDKWNPYVIAERLSNWIGFISEYHDGKNIEKYIDSIYCQVIELKSSLEYQLGANHLLSEAKALVIAGAFLKDTNLYNLGKKILLEEFNEQFLDDGGHYERSVSYHVESLQQYYETVYVMNLLQDPDISYFIELMKKPYIFLNSMISVNGYIPLFNDSAYDYPFYDARDFLVTAGNLYNLKAPNGRPVEYSLRWETNDIKKEYIDWKVQSLFAETGIMHKVFSCNGERFSVFIDVGNNGPDYNLGHAHADALSVLLSNEQKNILVDSGVFTYEPGIMRDECRSTSAHNTIQVDGTNNAEIWSAFRVARRGHTSLVEFDDNENLLKISASYDGYKYILKTPAILSRTLSIKEDVILIYDALDCEDDYCCVSRFHLGPECSVELIDENTCLLDGKYKLCCNVTLEIKECKVASYFGVLKKSHCIECRFFTKNTKQIITEIALN